MVVEVPVEPEVILMLSGAEVFSERVDEVARIYRQGGPGRIILTNDNEPAGWSESEQRNPLFYERAISELVKNGVPRSAVEVISQPVQSTTDEARIVRNYCEQSKIQSILIVTSAYHSRRALSTFRKVFSGSGIRLGVKPAATGIQTPNPFFWWLQLRGWKVVAGEYLKMLNSSSSLDSRP